MSYLYEAGGRRIPLVGGYASSANVAGLGALTAKELLKAIAKEKAKYKILITRRNSHWYDLETKYGVPKIPQMSDAWRTYFAAIRAGQTATRPTITIPAGSGAGYLEVLKGYNSQLSKQINEAWQAILQRRASTTTPAPTPTPTAPPADDFVGPPAPPPGAGTQETKKKFPWVAVGGVSAVVLVGALVLRGRKK